MHDDIAGAKVLYSVAQITASEIAADTPMRYTAVESKVSTCSVEMGMLLERFILYEIDPKLPSTQIQRSVPVHSDHQDCKSRVMSQRGDHSPRDLCMLEKAVLTSTSVRDRLPGQ